MHKEIDHAIDGATGLVEALRRAVQLPSEDEVYRSCMQQTLWSIDEFAALMGGLSPENYKNGTKGSTEITDAVFVKQEAFATKIFTQFLDYMDNEFITKKDFILTKENMYLSPWKYIKWAAQNKISLKDRFFEALPLSLMELYFEFQPINDALRMASKRSKTYHKALYLHHAKKLLKEFPNLKPTGVYRHRRMENIQRYLRELGGKYKKRTFIGSWLPEIIGSSRGRPKK